MQQRSHFLAWLIWSIAALFVLYQFLLQASTSVMIPCLMQAFHIDTEAVGFLSASFFYTYIILQIPSGILIDKIGAKKLLIGSILLCSLAALVFGMAKTLSVAEYSRLLMGLASAPSVVCAMYLASHWLPCEKFALAAGLTEMLGMLGGALGEAFLAHCVEGLGWRGTMYLSAGIGALLLVLTIVFVKDFPKKKTISKTNKNSHVKQDLIALVRHPQLWLIGLFAGFVFAIIQAFASLWAVPFLEQVYKVTLDKAAFASSMIFLGTALFAPLLSYCSDKIKRRKPLMFLCSIAGFVLMLGIAYIPPTSFDWMTVLLFCLGALCGIYVLPFAIAREITKPSVRATALGFTNMMTIVIGAPLLEPLIGALLNHASSGFALQNHAGNYQLAFFGLPLVLLLAFVVTFFIKETHCECLYE